MSTKVLICSERFLGRFGADRVMLNVANALHEFGNDVQLLGVRVEDSLVPRGIACRTINLDAFENLNHNEAVADLLEKDPSQYLEFRPDVTVVAGWPFFSALRFFSSAGRIVFIDFGVVPLKGFRDLGLRTQIKLRLLRRKYLNLVDRALPISDFIANSQTIYDVEDEEKVHTILLGADHLIEASLGQAVSSKVAEAMEGERQNGRMLVLLPGRFEAGNYKQCELVFPLVDLIEPTIPFKIVVLAEDYELTMEDRYKDKFLFMGRVSDADLAYIYSHVTCSLSLSSWEGFNLNIAESQSFQKPAFAFNVAAHPEVICDPYFLCDDLSDMAKKLNEYLLKGPPNPAQKQLLDAWIERFRWVNVHEEYLNSILLGSESGTSPRLKP